MAPASVFASTATPAIGRDRQPAAPVEEQAILVREWRRTYVARSRRRGPCNIRSWLRATITRGSSCRCCRTQRSRCACRLWRARGGPATRPCLPRMKLPRGLLRDRHGHLRILPRLLCAHGPRRRPPRRVGHQPFPRCFPPVGNYTSSSRSGDLLFVGGHGPVDGSNTIIGKVGTDLTLDEGRDAARLTALSILATMRADLGSLDSVDQIVKVFGMVNVGGTVRPDAGRDRRLFRSPGRRVR